MRIRLAKIYSIYIIILLAPGAAFSQVLPPAEYIGFIAQDNNSMVYRFTLNLTSTDNGLKGTAEIAFAGGRSGSVKNFIVASKFNIAGQCDPTGKTLTFTDVDVEKGTGNLFRKKYEGHWEQTADSIIIYGNWSNINNEVFNRKYVTNADRKTVLEYVAEPSRFANCMPGSFSVSKMRPGCVSGNCQDGLGVLRLEFGQYEGQFKNGKYEGQGTFTYTSGRLKGTVYKGGFSNSDFNGKGKIDYSNTASTIEWEEGTFVNNRLEGFGTQKMKSGRIFTGTYTGGQMGGIMKTDLGKIYIIGYFLDGDDTRALSFNVLKNHQDTTFAALKKCDCLQKRKFYIGSWSWATEEFYEYNAYGDKIGEGSRPELKLSNPQFDGFANTSDHDVYVRGYMVKHYKDRNVTEYADASFKLAPGEVAMGNYRLPPQPGQIYAFYFKDSFVYCGQFCEPNVAVCKPGANKGASAFSVLRGITTYDRIIKKGSQVIVSSKGNIRLGILAGNSTPNGIDGFESYSIEKGFRHGSLLVRLGENGKWRVAGSSVVFTAETTGRLQFLVNDNDDGNNLGGYEVTVGVK